MTKGSPDHYKTVALSVVHEGIPTTIETSLGYWKGREKHYMDAEFLLEESPRELNVAGDLGRNAHDGYVTVDGDGNLGVQISDDSINYGDESIVKKGEVLGLTGLDIAKIKLRAVAKTAYRVKVI